MDVWFWCLLQGDHSSCFHHEVNCNRTAFCWCEPYTTRATSTTRSSIDRTIQAGQEAEGSGTRTLGPDRHACTHTVVIVDLVSDGEEQDVLTAAEEMVRSIQSSSESSGHSL